MCKRITASVLPLGYVLIALPVVCVDADGYVESVGLHPSTRQEPLSVLPESPPGEQILDPSPTVIPLLKCPSQIGICHLSCCGHPPFSLSSIDSSGWQGQRSNQGHTIYMSLHTCTIQLISLPSINFLHFTIP